MSSTQYSNFESVAKAADWNIHHTGDVLRAVYMQRFTFVCGVYVNTTTNTLLEAAVGTATVPLQDISHLDSLGLISYLMKKKTCCGVSEPELFEVSDVSFESSHYRDFKPVDGGPPVVRSKRCTGLGPICQFCCRLRRNLKRRLRYRTKVANVTLKKNAPVRKVINKRRVTQMLG